MNDSVATAKAATTSNVYYLPVSDAAAEPALVSSRWTRLGRTWWRLRFALAGIRLALRPSPTPLFAEDDTLPMLQGRAELIERCPKGPARVIDFDAARARLRPAPAN